MFSCYYIRIVDLKNLKASHKSYIYFIPLDNDAVF